MIDPTWITAGAVSAGVIVALLTAAVGLSQLKQVRADSRERSRPMMAAELRKAPYTPGTQLLVIRNYGPSIARNVKVTFDPPIPDPAPERAPQSVSPLVTRRYAEPIPVIAPDVELSNIWFSGIHDHANGWENFEPTPDRFTVTITYDGPDGTNYVDPFPLDTDLINKHTYVSDSRDPENRLKEAVKSLAKIEKAITHIARRLNPLCEPATSGLSDDEMRALLGDRWPGGSQAEN